MSVCEKKFFKKYLLFRSSIEVNQNANLGHGA